MWFSQPNANWTLNPATGRPDDPIARIPGEPTLNAPELRTYNINVSSGPLDYTRTSPWRAPGSAPVYGSGCGEPYTLHALRPASLVGGAKIDRGALRAVAGRQE